MGGFDRTYLPSFATKRRSQELVEEPAKFAAKLAREVASSIRKALR